MRIRGQLISASLMVCVLCGVSVQTVHAGPLLDWLFHRNSATTPPVTAAAGVTPTANTLATNSPARQSFCGTGWCRQTVVQYMPQIAYRTAYQPVPVTTYKTTTTINPANGLPLTCTRPCTTYSYQARRVPYTTYRPVYTTVPVADASGQPAVPRPAAAVAPSLVPSATPPPSVPHSTQYGNAGATGFVAPTVPGYTPGTANAFPPVPQTTLRVPYGGHAATPSSSSLSPAPWRPLHSGPQPGSSLGGSAVTTGTQGTYTNGPGSTVSPARDLRPTEWQTISPGQAPNPPEASAGEAAGQRPSLPPDSGDAGYAARTRRLKPVPMPDAVRRQIHHGGSQADDAAEATNEGQPNAGRGASDDMMFSTPNRTDAFTRGNRGGMQMEGPSNQDSSESDEARRQSQQDSRALRDIDRDRRSLETSWPDTNDKTATRGSPSRRGRRPQHESEVTPSRYASVPINWSRSNQQTVKTTGSAARDRLPVSSRPR